MSDKDIPFMKIDEHTAILGGRYVVTSDGKIFGIRKGGRLTQLKPRRHTHGYLRFTYCDNHGQYDIYIHRIIARIFIDNPCGYHEVNHKDGDKINNSILNLEWCDRHQNNLHAFKTGLRKYLELKEMAMRPRPKARRLTVEDIKRIRGEEFNVNNTELGRKYGVNKESIRQIKLRNTYKEVA